jgi:hypothetical protein
MNGPNALPTSMISHSVGQLRQPLFWDINFGASNPQCFMTGDDRKDCLKDWSWKKSLSLEKLLIGNIYLTLIK